MATGTVRLHRILRAPPERVYQAFVDPDAICRWLPPYGYLCTVQKMEAKVGGSYRMTFRNFGTGNSHAFGGEYLEMVPGEKLSYSDRFEPPFPPGEMRTTALFKKTIAGTELSVVQEGIPDVIPEAMCYLGWQESLEQLAKLVEPEIPDE